MIANTRSRLPQPDSTKTVSGIPGAVQAFKGEGLYVGLYGDGVVLRDDIFWELAGRRVK